MNTLRLRDMQASVSHPKTASWLRWGFDSSWRKQIAAIALLFLPAPVKVYGELEHGAALFDCMDIRKVSHLAAAAAGDIAKRIRERAGRYDCDEASDDLLMVLRHRHEGPSRPACGRIAFYRIAQNGQPPGWHSAVIFWTNPEGWFVVEPQTGEPYFLSLRERESIRSVTV